MAPSLFVRWSRQPKLWVDGLYTPLCQTDRSRRRCQIGLCSSRRELLVLSDTRCGWRTKTPDLTSIAEQGT
jgi:hypothetical protein